VATTEKTLTLTSPLLGVGRRRLPPPATDRIQHLLPLCNTFLNKNRGKNKPHRFAMATCRRSGP